MCKFKDCEYSGYYNYASKKGGAYCSDHKSEEMIYRSNPLCSFESCKRFAYFYSKKNKLTHCSLHKLKDAKPRYRKKQKRHSLQRKIISIIYKSDDELTETES